MRSRPQFVDRLGFTADALQRGLGSKQDLCHLRQQVKKAYRTESLKLHPDHNEGCPEKAEQFKKLSLDYSDIETFLQQVKVETKVKTLLVDRPRVQVSYVADAPSTTFTSNWWERSS